MSSVRGGTSRGRGRGSTQQPAARGGGASNTRGPGFNTQSTRGNAAARGTFGQASRGNAIRPPRGSNAPRASTSTSQPPSAQGAFGRTKTTGSPSERFQALTKARERERADAIHRGLIADPEKPRSLADAITPVGTCQEMCPEYERVQRIVQNDVWNEETDLNHSAYAMTDKPLDEDRMVKKFRRAAAGLEEQLPSDLRPPTVLKRTCDYLINDMIGKARSLGDVHHFVWDRTRAVRNDFSIQQVQRREELAIAIECYERIARFHIMSLHQLALPEKPYSKYDWQQEREQLDRTLLSLMQLYDDSRDRVELPNEAEFRAYCVILQLQDPIPDLEDRIQSYPRHVLQDRRVQKAMEVYMAACNIMDPQGPLKPRADHLIARQDWQKFWTLVASKEVSYLMACAAEVYFNLVRRMVLNAIFRTSWQVGGKRRNEAQTSEWTVDVLCELLALDDTEKVFEYCEHFGFTFRELGTGQHYLDLTSVPGTTLPEPTAGIPKQSKSQLVEDKRFDRTLPAIIRGLSVKQAREAGLVTEQEEDEEIDMDDAMDSGEQNAGTMHEPRLSDPFDDGESLFVPERKTSTMFQSQTPSTLPNGLGETAAASHPFSSPGTGFTFGKPSSFGDISGSFPSQNASKSQEYTSNTPRFDFLKTTKASTPPDSPFNFTATSNATDMGTRDDVKYTTSAPVFLEPSRTSESVLLKPSTSSAATPFSFSSPSTAGPTLTPSLGEAASPKSNGSSFFTAPTPVPPTGAKAETPQSSVPNSQFSFGPATATPAAPLPRQPSSSPEFKASQPHFTTAPTQPTSALNPHISTPVANPGPRKLSSSRDHRPEKPSPLSNSFTAGDDSSAIIDSHPSEEFSKRSALQGPFPTQPSRTTVGASSTAKVRPSAPPEPPGESLDAVVARVADEFYTDPIRGILKQYIDFHVRQTVREVQDQIETEQLNEEAKKYNRFRLHTKYGRRWRDLFWLKRLAKSGRERRERRRRRLEQRSSQEIDGGSLLDAISSKAQSQTPSVAGAEDFGVRQSVEVDLYGRPLNYQSMAQTTRATEPVHTGMKRPMSSHGTGDAGQPKSYAHKRMKSTSHIDKRGRIAKSTSTSHPNNDILKRSSFLGYSPAHSGGPVKNTTKSSYFRLKALGVHRVDAVVAPRGTKRRLSASGQSYMQTSPPALRPPSSLGRSSAQLHDTSMMPPPSMTPSRPATANNTDDELMARLKAAREKLRDSTTFYKSEMEKDQDFRQSLKSSVSSNEFESPSMVRARSEARTRASQGPPEGRALSTRSDMPAYRLRESRFVPRENYGKAIERAREIRESRSRDTSRPESPQNYVTPQTEAKKMLTAVPLREMYSSTFGQSNLALHSANGSNGVSQSCSEPKGLSAFAPGSTSTTFAPHAPPISFANHTTKLSSENPFLKVPTGNAFPGFVPQETTAFNDKQQNEIEVSNPSLSQTTFFKEKPQDKIKPQDFTVQPSQINEALANSWGSSHGYGINKHLSIPQDMNTPPQQDSYLPSQAISLISDGEKETPLSTQHPQMDNAMDTEATEEILDDESDEGEHDGVNGHVDPYYLLAHQDVGGNEDSEADESVVGNNFVNPYAALARHDDDVDEESYDSDMEDEDGYDDEHISNGFAGTEDEDEDEEGVDGDIDDDETEEYGDEDAQRYEYSEDDYDETQQAHWQQQQYDAHWAAQSPQSSALQGVGSTAEEAIELSD